jgi:hypothetical protein
MLRDPVFVVAHRRQLQAGTLGVFSYQAFVRVCGCPPAAALAAATALAVAAVVAAAEACIAMAAGTAFARATAEACALAETGLARYWLLLNGGSGPLGTGLGFIVNGLLF